MLKRIFDFFIKTFEERIVRDSKILRLFNQFFIGDVWRAIRCFAAFDWTILKKDYSGHILKELAAYVAQKRSIEADHRYDPNTRQRQIQQLKLSINGSECTVEDLALTFW